MKRVVQVVEALAALCALVFVVALFANEPDDAPESTRDAPAAEGDAAEGDAADADGAAIYAARCASCHGDDGGGRNGPPLDDSRAVERFPDIEDQIALVTDGRNAMPSFEGRLSPTEIEAVVEYTRTL